jgi:hypothetical protein
MLVENERVYQATTAATTTQAVGTSTTEARIKPWFHKQLKLPKALQPIDKSVSIQKKIKIKIKIYPSIMLILIL